MSLIKLPPEFRLINWLQSAKRNLWSCRAVRVILPVHSDTCQTALSIKRFANADEIWRTQSVDFDRLAVCHRRFLNSGGLNFINSISFPHSSSVSHQLEPCYSSNCDQVDSVESIPSIVWIVSLISTHFRPLLVDSHRKLFSNESLPFRQ